MKKDCVLKRNRVVAELSALENGLCCIVLDLYTSKLDI